MAKMSVHEAKAHFSEAMRRVENGEVITVTRHGKPVAELRPLALEPQERRLGAFEGLFVIPDDAFDPMTEEELKDWYGE